jgi:hypothetical protein
MNSKIALQVATLAIGAAAFAAVPALAQGSVEKWDHGKKYYDYVGTMPPAPTQQELQSRQEDAAKARHLRGVTNWDQGKKYTDYMPEGQSGNM